jgi:hypothetical protein
MLYSVNALFCDLRRLYKSNSGDGVAEETKKRPAKKKPAAARRNFSTAAQARAQLEGITAAQARYRRAK